MVDTTSSLNSLTKYSAATQDHHNRKNEFDSVAEIWMSLMIASSKLWYKVMIKLDKLPSGI